MNDGAFALIHLITPRPRLVAAAIILLSSVVVPLIRKNSTGLSLIQDVQLILLVWFLVIPTPYPWYAVPLVAVTAVLGTRGMLVPVVVLSGGFSLYYLSFFFEYNDYPAYWWITTRAVEHALVWVSLVLHLIKSTGGNAETAAVTAGISSSHHHNHRSMLNLSGRCHLDPDR
jgi:hypothetical protein